MPYTTPPPQVKKELSQSEINAGYGPSPSAPSSSSAPNGGYSNPKSGTGQPLNPLPFLAQENANIKTIIGTDSVEPIYYSGRPREGLLGTFDAVVGNPLKNWYRRTWAKINDPYKILPDATPEQMAEIKRRAAEMQKTPENELIPGQNEWDKQKIKMSGKLKNKNLNDQELIKKVENSKNILKDHMRQAQEHKEIYLQFFGALQQSKYADGRGF